MKKINFRIDDAVFDNMPGEEYDMECNDDEDKAMESWEKGRESNWDEYEMVHYGGSQ